MFRRLRFSLRTMMVAFFAVAICAGAYGWSKRAEEEQRLAARQIAARGGTIYYDRTYFTKRVVFHKHAPEGCGQTGVLASPMLLKRPIFGDKDIPLLSGLWSLSSVNFAETYVTPAAIEQFRRSHPACEVLP